MSKLQESWILDSLAVQQDEEEEGEGAEKFSTRGLQNFSAPAGDGGRGGSTGEFVNMRRGSLRQCQGSHIPDGQDIDWHSGIFFFGGGGANSCPPSSISPTNCANLLIAAKSFAML